VRAVEFVSFRAFEVHFAVALQLELALKVLVTFAAHKRLRHRLRRSVLSLDVLAQSRGIAKGALAKAAVDATFAFGFVRHFVLFAVPITAKAPVTARHRTAVRPRVAFGVAIEQMTGVEQRSAARNGALKTPRPRNRCTPLVRVAVASLALMAA